MDTLFNFGDVYKNFEKIANSLLGPVKTFRIPITNTPVYSSRNVQIVSACYGAAMVRDSLAMLKIAGRLNNYDILIGLGSNGALKDSHLRLNDLTIPESVSCEYYGYQNPEIGGIIKPKIKVREALETALKKNKQEFKVYSHGSVFAVFDEHTNHDTYTNSLYHDGKVQGIDCSESFILSKFAKENRLEHAILLYCSDDPDNHISSLSKKDFDVRAIKFDKLINDIALQAIADIRRKN